MRFLEKHEAEAYLHTTNMKIGTWNQIGNDSDCCTGKSLWLSHPAPKNCFELHNFAQHVVGWLSIGDWGIFQIDNSTSLDEAEEFLIKRLLCYEINSESPLNSKSILFEFDKKNNDYFVDELLLWNLVFLFLLFQCHGQIVSSTCQNGKYISIQDGYVYFISFDGNDINDAKELVNKFKNNPLQGP